MINEKTMKFPDKKYKTILIDPPWEQRMSTGGRLSKKLTKKELDYPTMSIEDIQNLPVDKLANDGCHLWLWLWLWLNSGTNTLKRTMERIKIVEVSEKELRKRLKPRCPIKGCRNKPEWRKGRECPEGYCKKHCKEKCQTATFA